MGFLHAERPGRPALALDLVEPLRVAVVDAAVLTAVNAGAFGPEDCAAEADGAVRLSEAGRRRALSALERRLSEGFGAEGAALSWRMALSRAAEALAGALRGEGRALPAWPLPA